LSPHGKKRDQLLNIEQSLLDIVGHTYETAHDDEQWRLVTEGICRLLNASGARLLLVDKGHRHAPIVLGGGDFARYKAWVDRRDEDPWLKIAASLQPGDVRIGRELVSDQELLRTDFYYDLLKPADYRYAIGCVVDDTADYNVGLSLNRGPRQNDFDDRDRQLISKLAPHLKRAILLRNELKTSQQRTIALESGLHSLSSALAITDATGDVCFINQPMELLLDRQKELQILNKRIVAATRQKQLQLDQLIQTAAAIFNGENVTGSCSLSLTLNNTGYNLVALPLGSPAFYDVAGAQGCVAISISERTGGQHVSRKLLVDLYRLTLRETQLCEALMADLSLNDAAEKIGVTSSTARSYLKSIFQKVDVQSQSSLVLRLSKLSALR
jgi:DNA-binding CsgD family transcriptional regulator